MASRSSRSRPRAKRLSGDVGDSEVHGPLPTVATIVASATPSGRGALAIVRLSGPDVAGIRDRVLRRRGSGWADRRALRVDLVDPDSGHSAFDDGLAVFSPGPNTFTGEDTLEVTLHGNPLLVERFVAACIGSGARLARPGEFTRRAVLNGKLDLVHAEGIDQLIRAATPAGVEIARQAVRGALSEVLEGFRTELIGAVAELEARLDYPADELALETDTALWDRIGDVGSRCATLAASHQTGRRLVEGATVALVGPVNAGKSSLFNQLLGSTRALVHSRPGTTRDVVEARTRLGDLAITLLDTAGERETDDPIEAAGLALAGELTAQADLWLVVLRASTALTAAERTILERAASRPHIVIYNQIDRPDVRACPDGALPMSSATGQGLDALRSAITATLVHRSAEGLAIASLRQAELLATLAERCDEAIEAAPLAGVAVAAELLTEGLEALDALTGADTREDILDAVFTRFCIGK